MSDTASRYLTKNEYRNLKTALTRAVNTGNPLAVLKAVERFLDECDTRAWPDDWPRWSIALDDAYFAYFRSGMDDDDDVARFRSALERLFP